MNKSTAVWLAMAGTWFSTAACSSEPAAAERVSAQRFAAAFSEAQCDQVGRCCSLSNFEFDRVNCEGRLKASFQASLDTVLLEPVDYDEGAAGECLAALKEQQRCGAELTEFPDCRGMLVGRLQDGEPCRGNVTCKSGWCAQVGDAIEPVCAPLQGSGPVMAGKAGDDCLDTCEGPGNCPPVASSETPVVCYRSDGLVCGYSSEIELQQCQSLLEIGEACTANRQCEVGLFCQDVCQAPHPNGAECESGYECRSGVCLQGECVASAFDEETCASGDTGG